MLFSLGAPDKIPCFLTSTANPSSGHLIYFANIILKSPFGEVIIKYVCIKVPLNDVSCYMKNFTSLTCEQGYKNETNTNKHQALFFVVVRTGSK